MRMIPVVEIIRLEETEQGTLGVMRINKQVFCATLEESDRLNAANVSSIPAQQFVCRRVQSPRLGETFQVMDVPGRSHILFHAGNTDRDTEGCILLGSTWGNLSGRRAVLNSGATYREFMGVMAGRDEFHLTVKEEY